MSVYLFSSFGTDSGPFKLTGEMISESPQRPRRDKTIFFTIPSHIARFSYHPACRVADLSPSLMAASNLSLACIWAVLASYKYVLKQCLSLLMSQN